ncbi:MAG: hypothetical protein IKY27_00185 [Bacteroidales bacterium]|nr:hypothetical protein [Bacteroidales bacterium]
MLRQTKLFFKRNGSTILTVLGGIGVVATSVMAVKDTPKALRLLDEAKKKKGDDLTKFEMVKVAGPVYIPTVLVGVSTLGCVFGANALNKKHQAALVGAYGMLNESYKNFRNKVDEVHGEGTSKEIDEAIVEDKTKNELRLFYDIYSQRFFETTLFKVQLAEYNVNRDLVMRDYVYLNEWYEYLDIPTVEEGWDVGWSTGFCFEAYWQPWIDFAHSDGVTKDGREYISIGFFGEPTKDFEDYF